MKLDNLLESLDEFSHETYKQPVLSECASIVPLCVDNDSSLSEVIETLERLQNESIGAPQDRTLGIENSSRNGLVSMLN